MSSLCDKNPFNFFIPFFLFIWWMSKNKEVITCGSPLVSLDLWLLLYSCVLLVKLLTNSLNGPSELMNLWPQWTNCINLLRNLIFFSLRKTSQQSILFYFIFLWILNRFLTISIEHYCYLLNHKGRSRLVSSWLPHPVSRHPHPIIYHPQTTHARYNIICYTPSCPL